MVGLACLATAFPAAGTAQAAPISSVATSASAASSTANVGTANKQKDHSPAKRNVDRTRFPKATFVEVLEDQVAYRVVDDNRAWIGTMYVVKVRFRLSGGYWVSGTDGKLRYGKQSQTQVGYANLYVPVNAPAIFDGEVFAFHYKLYPTNRRTGEPLEICAGTRPAKGIDLTKFTNPWRTDTGYPPW